MVGASRFDDARPAPRRNFHRPRRLDPTVCAASSHPSPHCSCSPLAPAAQAGWFAAEAVDGPAEIDALGDVDVARDGSGGLVYLKRDGGSPQVFLSRLDEGVWQPPEKLSGGAPVTEAAVTATDGGRLAVAWVAGGQVLGTVIPAAAQAQAPAPPVVLGGGGATGVAIDMGINEDGYAVWSAGGDVRAARLDGTTWTPLAAPLDVDPARTAGEGASRPRVARQRRGQRGRHLGGDRRRAAAAT